MLKDWLNALFYRTQRNGGRGVGLEDVAVNALWNPSDERDIDEEIWANKRIENKPLSFQDKLLRYYNDQTVHFDRSNHTFEPIVCTGPKYDLVTLAGLGRVSQLIAGKTTRTFTHYATGTGTAPESSSDIRLQAEHFRVSMITDGFSESAGNAVKMAGKLPTSAPTAVISEAGTFDSAIGGTIFFRTVFDSAQRINHIQFQSLPTVSQTVSMISIT